jgi:hypothetical protein
MSAKADIAFEQLMRELGRIDRAQEYAQECATRRIEVLAQMRTRLLASWCLADRVDRSAGPATELKPR